MNKKKRRGENMKSKGGGGRRETVEGGKTNACVEKDGKWGMKDREIKT